MGHHAKIPSRNPVPKEPYLLLRGNRYFFRIKIPAELRRAGIFGNRKDIKVPLKTASVSEATASLCLFLERINGPSASDFALDRIVSTGTVSGSWHPAILCLPILRTVPNALAKRSRLPALTSEKCFVALSADINGIASEDGLTAFTLFWMT